MSPEIQTFLLAMTPIGELRASIPVALTIYHLNWAIAFLVSVIGNLIPVIFILLFLEPVSNWLFKKSAFFNKFFVWLFEKTRKKHSSKIEKYGAVGLATFVAIPFPLTGGWSGAILAFLFGIPFKKAFFSISAGVITAGTIVLAVVQSGIMIEKYFGWQMLLGVIMIIGISWFIYKKLKKN